MRAWQQKEWGTKHAAGPDSSAGSMACGIANPLNVGNCGISFFDCLPMETQIKESLISLLNGIKASDGQVIADSMARLDEFLERGRAGLHPQLVHFLQNRSYAKALMFLGGEIPLRQGFAGQATNPPGGCATQTAKRVEG